jgi:hypothetical protein
MRFDVRLDALFLPRRKPTASGQPALASFVYRFTLSSAWTRHERDHREGASRQGDAEDAGEVVRRLVNIAAAPDIASPR